jgi:hypothetical protein
MMVEGAHGGGRPRGKAIFGRSNRRRRPIVSPARHEAHPAESQRRILIQSGAAR